jgi:hypothetical protein
VVRRKFTFLVIALVITGFDSRQERFLFLFATASTPALGPTQGFWGLILMVVELDLHLFPPYVFTAWYYVKYRDGQLYLYMSLHLINQSKIRCCWMESCSGHSVVSG